MSANSPDSSPQDAPAAIRRHLSFASGENRLFATLDSAACSTGLLIVSGGNELRSGAHSGMSQLAALVAEAGYPVFRFDRSGIGDSEGINSGYTGSAEDIAAAMAAFRHEAGVSRIMAMGNCDAASALLLFAPVLDYDALLLSNPWTWDEPESRTSADDVEEEPATQSDPALLRDRLRQRITDPQAVLRLLRGKVDLRSLASDVSRAVSRKAPSALAMAMSEGLRIIDRPCHLLLAAEDNSARAFRKLWDSRQFDDARGNPRITLDMLDSASHSFAGADDRQWLHAQVLQRLQQLDAG